MQEKFFFAFILFLTVEFISLILHPLSTVGAIEDSSLCTLPTKYSDYRSWDRI